MSATLVVLLELAAWSAWLQGFLVTGAVAHILAATWLVARHRDPWSRWQALTVLTMPGLGLGALLVRPGPAAGTAVDELAEYMRPTFRAPPPAGVTREAQVRELLTTDATLITPDLGEAGAVRSLAESVPDFGDAVKVRRLLALMKDPSSDTYHVAAARVARLQEHFALLIYRAREAGDDVGLGEVYVKYLKSGLLDGVLADFYYKLAVERFQAAAALEPASFVWPLRVAELHRRNGRYREALETCQAVLERFPDQMEARMRILEIYFYGARLGVAEATRHFLLMLERLRSEIDPSQVADPSLRNSASWWFPRA